ADAICPPPEAFDGRKAAGTIVKPASSGLLERRRAEFIPLAGEGNSPAAVLVIIDRENLPSDSAGNRGLNSNSETADSSASESAELHEAVQRFRREMNAWHHLNRLAGVSAALQRVRAQVKMAAAADGAIVIVGPPGIGRQH